MSRPEYSKGHRGDGDLSTDRTVDSTRTMTTDTKLFASTLSSSIDEWSASFPHMTRSVSIDYSILTDSPSMLDDRRHGNGVEMTAFSY